MTIDLSDFNDEELRKLAVALEALDKKDVKNTEKPRNDDELHAWILNNLGINVTRKATCPEHDAPFDVIADLFFGREDSALVIGSRGSGKTYIASLWIYLSCHFNPNIEAATVGAIEIQAKRAYSYLKDFINKKGDEKIADSLISETKWEHGAKAEILTGSKSCHPANELILTTKGYKPISELDPQKDQLASFNKPYLTWGNIPGKIVKGETSKYPGVTYHKNIGKYQAQVNSEEGRVHIGFFDTEEEAWEQVVKYHDENPKIVFPFKIDSWDYDGPLYVIKTENSVTKVTPNHELLLKLTKESRDKWVVYLMKKGEYWRIGKTSVSRLSKRANEEDCEGLWALSVHDTEKDCIASEIILQTKYQLPPVCFDNKTVHDAVKDISSVGARRLLAERNMYENLPLIQRKGTSRKLFDNQWIKTIAANIVPFSGLFEVPTTTEKFENLGGREEAVNLVAYVDVEDYSGKVYGIEIEPFHLYVANGQVVSNSVNGPHPQRVHRDEIELMDIDVYEESLMMESSKKTPDGEFIKAQTLVTSTRKTSDGLMQKIIDECEEAKREGRKPPFRIYNICIKDVIEQVPNCREAYPDLPEEEKCQCHLVQNGEWDDGRPRLFSDVCGGILANAQGYKPITDAHTIFLKSSKHKWEAQQENKRPYVEDITFPEFSRERHGIREFELDPANGPIYCSIDFGGCYDEDTEVLTKRGWLKFKDTTPEDEFASLNPETELVEYQKPRSYIEKQHFGHMERYKNKNIDLLVTPNHKMFVAPVSGDPTGKWELIRSDQTPKSSRMSKTSNGLKDSNRYVPDDRFSPEEWAAFMGIWLAEGHTHLGKTPNGNERKTGVIGITHYTEDNLNYIKQILESKGIKTRKSSTGQLLFNDKKIFSILREFGGACDKYIPAYIKEWDKDLLLLFLDWYDRGDGDGRRIYTCSKQMADDLQEIAMYVGYAANINVRPPKESSIRGRKIRGNHPQYVVSINKTQVKPRIHNKPHEKETKTIVSKEEWAGRKVYCVELPKYHTLYVRRNGKAVWCGNSNPHAVEWIQVLDYEIEVIGYNGQPKRLKEGTRILFDELYIAEIGNKKLADLIVEKEMMYRRLNQGFKVAGRFADPQAKAARLDFRDHRPPLVCSWPAVTRDREEHVKRMRDILVDNLFVVDVERCEMFCEEIEVWHQRNKKFDHAVDSTLYNVSNIYALEVSNDRKSFETPAHMGKNHIYGPTPFGDDSIPVARKSPLRSARSLNKWD